jgi:hypothetical protein
MRGALADARPADTSLEPELLDALESLIAETCARYGVAEAALSTKRADSIRAKREICERATRTLGLRPADLARSLGVADSTIHRLIQRARTR